MNKKIAIYAICKNEIKFVDQWIKSMIEADYICVLDTGSTDGTYEKLLTWQQQHPQKIILSQKSYKVWRFDVARNDSMKLVPADADILLSTDLDEWLEPNWSFDIKNNWEDNQTRGLYLYAWNHTSTGAPSRTFWYDKLHTKEYKWVYPVHEALAYVGNQKEIIKTISNRLLLHHYADSSKSRKFYLDLLELRMGENPADPWSAIYLSREYFANGMYQKSIQFIHNQALALCSDSVDGFFLPQLYYILGVSYARLGEVVKAEKFLNIGIASLPVARENYFALIELLMIQNRVEEAYDVLEKMFKTTRRYYSWLEDESVWGWAVYNLAAWVYLSCNNREEALNHALLAYTLNPTEELKQRYNAIYKEIYEEASCKLTPISDLIKQNKVQ